MAVACLGLLWPVLPCRADDWPTYQHDLQNTGRSTASFDPRALSHSWSSPVGFMSPIVVGGRVFASRDVTAPDWPRREYAAFDLRTGRQLWSQQVKWLSNAAAVADGMLVTYDNDQHLRAFDAETGALLHDTAYAGIESFIIPPALVDAPGVGTVEAYFVHPNFVTRFDVARGGSTLAWTDQLSTTGGVPTVAGESIITTGPGAYVAYRRSDGQRNRFYSGPITGGATGTGVYDAQRHRFYAEETHETDYVAITAWDYTDNGHLAFLWKLTGATPPALDVDGNLWFVDDTGVLREYSPDRQLLRSSTRTFAVGNTLDLQDGYVWVSDATHTLALDIETLEPVASLPGRNPLGNGVYSVGMIFDDGIVIDRGSEAGFDVYVVPEPAAGLLSAATAAMTLRRRGRGRRAAIPPRAS